MRAAGVETKRNFVRETRRDIAEPFEIVDGLCADYDAIYAQVKKFFYGLIGSYSAADLYI